MSDDLRERRLSLGMSLKQLATAAGVSDAAVSRIERGERTPKLDTLNKLRAALGLDSLVGVPHQHHWRPVKLNEEKTEVLLVCLECKGWTSEDVHEVDE